MKVDAATFIPSVGLFAGGATFNVNSFTVILDDKGIVRSISSTQTQGRSGVGAGEQSPPDNYYTSKVLALLFARRENASHLVRMRSHHAPKGVRNNKARDAVLILRKGYDYI